MSIGEQLDLGWRYDPLEKRDRHGRWTRAGSVAGEALSGMTFGEGKAYEHPPADRVAANGAKASDNAFLRKYGLSADHIVDAYDDSTPDERDQGMRWYADAHDVARMIGGGDAGRGAALLATYSPQVDWATNVMNAAHAAAAGKSPGKGVGITASVEAKANHILERPDGSDFDDLFPPASAPKTRAFYRTIKNGGDLPEDDQGEVVVDRHALSVAAGRRLTKDDTETPTFKEIREEHPDWTEDQVKAYRATKPEAPMGSTYTYQHIADMYREAAVRIAEKYGTPIAPHQVQAITWLRQQRLNTADEVKLIQMAEDVLKSGGRIGDVPGAKEAKGRASRVRNAWTSWGEYAKAHGIPVHVGTTAMQYAGGIGAQLDMAFDPFEPRDSRGRWTRFPGSGEAALVMEKNREGFSVSPRTGEAPEHGFMVALEGHTHRYPAEILDDPVRLRHAIDDLLMSERESFQGKDMFLGGWVEDGKLWLDPSQNVPDRETAERLGRERDQVGIFNLDTFETISTGGSGGGRIIDHQLATPAAEGSRGGAGGILGPAGGGAPGGGGQDRRRHQGGIGSQLDLAEKAWEHELRGPDGRWVSVGGAFHHPGHGHGIVTLRGTRNFTVHFEDGSVRRYGSLMEQEPVGDARFFKTRIGPTEDVTPDPHDLSRQLSPEIPATDAPWGPHEHPGVQRSWELSDQNMIPYTTRGNAKVEAALRRGEVPEKPMNVEWVDKIIASRHLTQPTDLYRGIGLTPELEQKLKPGAVFSDKSYTSTTTSPEWADEFAHFRVTGTAPWAGKEMMTEPMAGARPARMIIHAQPGQEIGPGEPGLAEYVLPRDSRYRVDRAGPGADGMHEIHLSVLPSGPHTQLKPVQYEDPRDVMARRRHYVTLPSGDVVVQYANGLGAQLELSGWKTAWMHERRDRRGRWTRSGLGAQLEQHAVTSDDFHVQARELGTLARDKSFSEEHRKLLGRAQVNLLASRPDYDEAFADMRRVMRDLRGSPSVDFGKIEALDKVAMGIRRAARKAHERGLAESGYKMDLRTVLIMHNDVNEVIDKFPAGSLKGKEFEALHDARNALSNDDYKGAAIGLHIAYGLSRSKARKEVYQRVFTKLEDSSPEGPPERVATPESQAAKDMLDVASQAVPAMLGNGSVLAWDHKAPDVFADSSEPGTLAAISWEGHVRVQQSVASRLADAKAHPDKHILPLDYIVPFHEILHAAVQKGRENRQLRDEQAYQRPANQIIEEGFTQLGATMHAPEFFSKLGMSDRESAYAWPSDAWDEGSTKILGDAGDMLNGMVSKYGVSKDLRDIAYSANFAVGEMIDSRNAETWPNAISKIRAFARKHHDDELLRKADNLEKSVNDVNAKARHYTVGDYALTVQAPNRVMSGQSWSGIYPEWTAQAYAWTDTIAQKLNGGEPDDRDMITELSDEVNAVGTADKTLVMARQLIDAWHMEDVQGRGYSRSILDNAREAAAASIRESFMITNTPSMTVRDAIQAYEGYLSLSRFTHEGSTA